MMMMMIVINKFYFKDFRLRLRTGSCSLRFGHQVANKPFHKTTQALVVLTTGLVFPQNILFSVFICMLFIYFIY